MSVPFRNNVALIRLRACLHKLYMYESGKPKVGYMQVTRLGGATINFCPHGHPTYHVNAIKLK